MKTNIKCIFTDLNITNLSNDDSVIEYELTFGDFYFKVKIHKFSLIDINNNLIPDKKWILKGLIQNGIWHNEEFTSLDILNNLIEANKSLIPKTPKDKKDKLLNYLYNIQGFDGFTITLHNDEDRFSLMYWNQLFFRNRKELEFYLDYLKEENFLNFTKNTIEDRIQLKTKGIEYAQNLNEGVYSTNCFVAMSFSNTMLNIYEEVIKQAILETGFKPILISNELIESDRTINDAIISELKKARFTIADFTENRNGVYFEAGFALGRGQKVIYCCKESDLGELHFDVKAFQHIVWNNKDDFKRKLIDKINAYIKD